MRLRGLRQARQRSGLSIGQLAEITGLRRETIAHLEHGKEEPQPYVVHRLVATLGTSAEDLAGEQDTKHTVDIEEHRLTSLRIAG